MNKQRIRLWDLPTRLFHWLLVLAVIAAVVSGQLGGNLIEVHGKIGLAIVGLIAFRLVWGFAGSTYARFAQFFPTPARIKVYLKGEWRGLGHNPLGGLSVDRASHQRPVFQRRHRLRRPLVRIDRQIAQ